VRHNLRPSDFAARYGGEEFAVLLERTNSQTAADMANRLREAFATNRVVIRESRQAIGTVTISAGVAMFRPGESTTDWLKRADMALYSAKQSGRNRVVQAA
jgi:diguanylate cyclase